MRVRWLPMLFTVLALGARPAAAQVPILYALSSQQNPPGLHWRRIDTPHFTVIFPADLGSEAQRAASLLERAYDPLTKTLAAKPERIPVVLTNRSMVSNAYVGWGPRRSQWYALPPTSVDVMGPVEWYSLLAVHEGRHIVQERAMRTGIIGVLARLFGDNTTSFLAGALYFPSWFWEGDAVGTETALTADGRGRQPNFTQRIRALTLAGEPYPYYPAWEGSYRTYYPDWYELGYVITTHVKRTYGDSAWRRVIVRAARNPVAPEALSKALKHETGRTLLELHRDALVALGAIWRAQLDAVTETPATVQSLASADYHEFTLPQYAADGSLIALYSDLDHTPRLVRVRDGNVEVLHAGIGLYGEMPFHVQGKTVVWSEYVVSPRWGEENFLVIKTLDLDSRRVRQLTTRSRYVAPVLSPDGKRIAAVEFSRQRVASLVVLDAENGTVLQRLPNASGHFLLTPTWTPDGSALDVVAIDGSRGNALVRVSLQGGSPDTLIAFTHDAISRPVERDGRIFFGSPRSGLDNIYALDLATRALYQVSSRRLGAAWPSLSPTGDSVAFSDYGIHGYDIATMALDPAALRAVASDAPPRASFADPLVAQEQGGSILDSLVTTPWESRPFTGWSRLFDFHSLALSPTTDGVNTGLVLYSRNVLNTVGVVAGPTYNFDEGTISFDAGASYAGLPVIVDASVRVGERASTYTDSAGAIQSYRWGERSVATSLRLPLTRLRGQTRQSLTSSVTLGRTHISDQPVAFRYENNNGDFSTMTYVVSASQVRASAYRDLYPVGAVVTGIHRDTPFGSDYSSRQTTVLGAAYLPGLRPHHALVLDVARQEQRPGNYRFSSYVLFPRGYDSRFHESLLRAGATYHFPLLYPDLALGNWLYFRRVQGNVFGDVGRGEAHDGTLRRDYRSAGGAVTVDVSPFGLRATIRTGVRMSRTLTGTGRTVWQAIVELP
ncbi:MAG: hypothetical protein ABI910_02710 [Gemmatimonadota bacterium]